MRLRSKKLVWAGLALLLLLAAAGHVWFWYSARERPDTPLADSLPACLLASGEYEAAFWIPYPHQNLAVLSDAVGDAQGWLAAASRLAGVPPPRWASFGPFAVPPAHEMTVAGDEDGERFLVAARIYPGLGFVARWAGKLAGNPWLAGGRVQTGSGPVEVDWQGTLWTVRRGEPPSLPPTAEPVAEESLALLRLSGPRGVFPGGTYRLRHAGDGTVELATLSALPADDLDGLSGGADRGVLLTLVNGPGGPLSSRQGALLLFDRETDRTIDLPAAAVLVVPASGEGGEGDDEDGSGDRLRLPQERLPSVLRGRLRTGQAAGLEVVASDRPALADAQVLAPDLARLLETGRVSVALWLDPRPMLGLVDDAVGVLEDIPLLSDDEVQRWRDWRTVLMPISQFDRVTLVYAEPDRFRLHFVPGSY